MTTDDHAIRMHPTAHREMKAGFEGRDATTSPILGRVISADREGVESGALTAAAAAGRVIGGGFAAPGVHSTRGRRTIEIAPNPGEALRLNILNSDATLVVVLGDQDDGDKLLATRIALRMRKPCMTLALPNRRARMSARTAAQLVAWARGHDVKTLHVTGPSECQEPGLGELTRLAVAALLAAADAQGAAPEGEAEVVDVPAEPELERRRADTVPDTDPEGDR